jgi:RNA polymerase sigma factor (sigma-70 family)
VENVDRPWKLPMCLNAFKNVSWNASWSLWNIPDDTDQRAGGSNRRNSSGVRDNTAFDERILSVDRSTINAETSLLEKENAELISEALAEVPLEYREVLVLRELEELSHLEIASTTRIPLGTVMSRLSRARKRLQQSFLDLAAGRNPDLQPSIALDGGVAT